MLRYWRSVAWGALSATAMLLFAGGASAGPPSFVPHRLLVQFCPTATAEEVRSTVANANAREVATIPQIGLHILQLPDNANETAVARAFAQRPEVAFAELDTIHQPDAAATNDPYYNNQWHLPKMSCPSAWSIATGSNVIVAILDTGCDPNHPDLASKYVPGWNFYDNNADWSDVYGHGTKTAGTVGACANNGIGVASIAWNCKIMPIRISAVDGGGSISAMANGLTWASDRGARVANISYQVSSSSTIATAARYFQAAGGVVTISAGNYSTVHTNADNPYVLTVSATTSSDTLASFSDSGSDVDVCGPGSGIYTTAKGGGYASVSGTSFSAPATAGVAALVISANPMLTGQQVQDIIKQSADDLGTPGWDSTYAWGRINAARAVSMAINASGIGDAVAPVVAFAAPGEGATIAGNFPVQASAADNTIVASVTLYLDGVQVASASSSLCNFAWNTFGVSNGLHALRAVAMDAAGNASAKQINVNVYNAPDTTAPTVAILSPIGGTVGNSLSVSAGVSDDRGAIRLELWVDGKLTQTDTSAPWSFNLYTRKWGSSAHTLQCVAYDAAGNAGYSQIVTLTK